MEVGVTDWWCEKANSASVDYCACAVGQTGKCRMGRGQGDERLVSSSGTEQQMAARTFDIKVAYTL